MSIKESSIEEQLTKLKMNPRWWEANKHQYTLEDWWRFCADESTMTLGEVAALIQSERRKAAIEILLRIRDKTDFMRGAGMELNIESTIWNELEVLDPSLNDERMAELEGEEI